MGAPDYTYSAVLVLASSSTGAAHGFCAKIAKRGVARCTPSLYSQLFIHPWSMRMSSQVPPTPPLYDSKFYQNLESLAASISRILANILFALWLITGLPLLLLLPCTYDTTTKQMKYGPCHPLVLLISFSWFINATLALIVLHGLNYISAGMTPWQAAALGWSLGVSSVTYLQASLDGKTSEAIHRIMLRPFGIRIRPGGEGNTVGWFPSLVGMIPAIVLYFVADWFGEVREELACEAADSDASASDAYGDGSEIYWEGYNVNGNNTNNATLLSRMNCPPWSFPSQDGTLCCHVENQTGNWLEFSAYLAGSVLAGWAVIRFVALFLIWGDDLIDLSDDCAMRTNGDSNAKADNIREVLIAFSRGEVSRTEIELMLDNKSNEQV